MSRTRTIGVLGTRATVRQAYVDDLAAKFAGDCRVIRHGSAELVELAEAKLRGEMLAPESFAAVLDGLFGQKGGESIDVIVNACTHFPLVEAELAAAAPRPVAFVDGGPGIARRIAFLTEGQDWPTHPGEGVAVFTRLGEREQALAPGLAARGFARIEAL
jgi:glutamate racemase